VDSSTGALTSAGNLMTPMFATDLFRDPGQHFLYVKGSLSNQSPTLSDNVIAQYTVNSSGSPQQAPGSPFNFKQEELAFMAIRPDRRFAYISDFSSATILHIMNMDPSSGALLQEVATVSIPVGANASVLLSMNFDSSGKYLYLANAETNTIAAYSSDSSTGTLTAVPGGPFTARGQVQGGCSPKSRFCGAEVAITGNHLYYVSTFYDSVAAFNLDSSTGALSEVLNGPFALPAKEAMHALTTPDGKFLYVESPSEAQITGYSIDSGSGALTNINGSPWSTVTGSQLLTIDSTGGLLYDTGAGIDGFQINQSSGALTRVPGAPYPLSSATGLAIVH
jgi:6-phosphogluconolactonase (cycloisomerase 2 family)